MPAISPEAFGGICHAMLAKKCHAWDISSKILPLATLELTKTMIINFNYLCTSLIGKF